MQMDRTEARLATLHQSLETRMALSRLFRVAGRRYDRIVDYQEWALNWM